jgi:RNA polymerase sigma-70 factor (ECF subfamily)
MHSARDVVSRQQGAQVRFVPESKIAPTDGALVEAARAGNRSARETLFKRHMSRVRGISQRVLAGQEGADDVAQDAWVEAIAHLGGLTHPQAFASWMAAIVVRRALKHLRHRQVLLRLGLQSSAGTDFETMASATAPAGVVLELSAACAALDGLPEQERTVLLLRRVEGLQLAEISSRMNLSLATVKRRLAAAEQHLSTRPAKSEQARGARTRHWERRR